MAKLKISVAEGLQYVLGKMRDAALGVVPDAEKLQILIERSAADTDGKRQAYHAALSSEVELLNPEHPDEGKLPALRAKLARRESQGQAWGKEFAETTNTQRKGQLKGYLTQCSADCDQLEADIQATESLLAERQETTKLRKDAYESAKADYLKLRTVAPTILEHTNALNEAKRERLEALKDAGKSDGDNAAEIIQQLQEGLDDAKAGSIASSIIEGEETEVDLDQVAEEEADAATTDARINRWTGK